VLRCRLLGHRFRFASDGSAMRWECRHGCGTAGEKLYASEDEAARYARAFNREDRDKLGRNKLTLSLMPLRLFRRFRR
jgi:hypothetical protein